MTRAPLTLVVLSAVGLPACLPYALPPGQAEIGLARYATGGRGTIAHLTAGVHSASIPGLVDKPMDFGVGYGVDSFSAKEGETSKVRTHGLYGEASRYVVRQPFWRVSVGGRGEMLFGGGEIGWARWREAHRAVPGRPGVAERAQPLQHPRRARAPSASGSTPRAATSACP